MVDSIVFKVFFVILSYLIGSVCFGYVVAKIFKKKDFAKKDLPGAAGTFRQYGYKMGILTGFLDTTKAAVPILIAKHVLGLDARTIAISCVALVVGHNWPVFFKFMGGGGLTTTVGIGLALAPREFAIAFPSAVALGFIYKYTLRKRLKFHPNAVGGGFGVLLLPILACTYKEPWPVIAAFAIIFIIIAIKGPLLSKIYTNNR